MRLGEKKEGSRALGSKFCDKWVEEDVEGRFVLGPLLREGRRLDVGGSYRCWERSRAPSPASRVGKQERAVPGVAPRGLNLLGPVPARRTTPTSAAAVPLPPKRFRLGEDEHELMGGR